MKNFMKWILTLVIIGSLVACSSIDKEAWQEQYDLGMKYLEEGNYEEAVIVFTKAIEIDVKSAVSYVGRGDAYTGLAKQTEDLEEAKEYFEKALQDYEEAENLGSEEVESKKLEVEGLLGEAIKKIAEAIKRDEELLQQQEGMKELMEPLYKCFMENDIEGVVELIHQEEYMKFSENIESDDYCTIYEDDNNDDKLIVYNNYQAEEHHYYFGEIVNGKRHGKGTWIEVIPKAEYQQDEKDIYYKVYIGEWKEDLPNGEGKIIFEYKDTSDNYECIRVEKQGTFKNALYDGTISEIYYTDDGNVYIWEPMTVVEGV